MQYLHNIFELVLSVACFLLGIVFYIIPVPENKYLGNYRISIKLLSANYFIFSTLNFILLLFSTKNSNLGYFDFLGLSICSTQIFLLAFVLLTLLNPRFFSLKKILVNLLPICIFTIVFFVLNHFDNNPKMETFSQLKANLHKPTVILRLLYFVYYVKQFVHYVVLFYKEERRYKNDILNYFSDTHKLNLTNIKVSLWGAVLVGVAAMFWNIIPSDSYNMFFSVVTNVFYILFAINFLKYNKLYSLIDPAISYNTTAPNLVSEQIYNQNLEPIRPRINWANLKKCIISEKYYLKEGVTLEEIAGLLKIGRTTLSNFINSEEKMNFYAWINSLRIEYAKSLFLQNPEYTVSQVATMTGYSETANFSRHFKKLTGESPSDWRKNNLQNNK